MAPIDYDDEPADAEDKYHESSDEDFNPDAAPPEELSSSEDEDHTTTKAGQRRRKRQAPIEEELDSGDEVTIQAARKKRLKKGKKSSNDNDNEDELVLSEDEGGEGGLIKTRAQRRLETRERRPLARTEGATVDVDALWAQMNAAPLKPLQLVNPQESAAVQSEQGAVVSASVVAEEEELIFIKKVYTFAGQDTTEEKHIPRSQLQKYVSDGWKAQDPTGIAISTGEVDPVATSHPSVRRPLRRPTRFDPNPSGYVRALPPEHQLFWPRKSATAPLSEQEIEPASNDAPKPKTGKTHRLNVVDKSRLDWTGFVDKEGIAEELDTHGKTKEAYLGRMEFLAGVEARREEERRNAKLKSSTAAL